MSTVSLYRYGEPSGGIIRLRRHDRTIRNNVHPAVPGLPTNTGELLASSSKQPPPPPQAPLDAYYQRRTDAPINYAHEYEREIARWQARRTLKRERWQRPLICTCSVCLESMDPSVWVQPTAFCIHGPRICEPCLGQYVMHAVREEGLTEVVCPHTGCRHQLEAEDVVKYIQEDLTCLNRYNALVAQRELERQPNWVWCQNPPCGQGQIHSEGGASPLVICQHCQASSCFIHRIPWHEGISCDEYTAALREGQIFANEEYIGKRAKRCPNPSCRRPIEKVSGCDRMTCYRPGGCGHEFCWVCLADYAPIRQQGNHRHNFDCIHYTRSTLIPELPGFEGPPRRRRLTIRGVGTALLRGRVRHRQAQPDPPRPPRMRPRARSTRRLVVLNFLFGRS